MEEGKLLIAGELVLDGHLPHRDFEHLYGPGDVYAVAVAFAIAKGPSVAAERAVGVMAFAVLITSVFAIARLWGAIAAVAAGILAGTAILPFGLHAYSWVTGLALVTASTALLARLVIGLTARPRLVAFAAGLLAGLSLFFRADLAAAVVLLGAAAAITIPSDQIRRAAIGALTGAAAYLPHIGLAGPGAVLSGMVRDPLFRLRSGRALPIPPPADQAAGWFDAVAPTPEPFALLPDVPVPLQLRLVFFLTAGAALLVVVAAALPQGRRRARGPVVLLLAALTVGVAPQMLQRADGVHIRFVAVVALMAAALALAELVVPQRGGVAAPAIMAGVALAASLVAPHYAVRLVANLASDAYGTTPVAAANDRTFPVHERRLASAATSAVRNAGAATSGRRSPRVFIGPEDLSRTPYSDAFLYHLLPEMHPATYFLEMNPGTTNAANSGLADDLKKADVLILSTRYSDWDEPNSSTTAGSRAPARVVQRRFAIVGEYGPYRVYVNRATVRPGVPTAWQETDASQPTQS